MIVIAVLVSKAVIVSTKTDKQSKKQGTTTTTASIPTATLPESTRPEAASNTPTAISNTKITEAPFVAARKTKHVATIYGAATPRELSAHVGVVSTGPTLLTAVNARNTQPRLLAQATAIGIIPTAPGRQPGSSWQSLRSMPGVVFEAEAITDASTGTAVMTSARSFRTHESFAITLDMDSLVGWPGLTLYAQHKNLVGGNGSGNAALVQNFSNIDADNFSAWGEVFAEQHVLGDRLRIKAGRLDFNSDFAGTDNGGDFLNASMGFSPNITAAPTFPLPTAGAIAFYAPTPKIEIGGGAFNGLDGAPAPEGSTSRFLIAQANARWSVGANLAGRTGIGYFKHTGVFASTVSDSENVPVNVVGASGWYATLDQTLWSATSSPDEESTRSVAAFFQLGHSNPRVAGVRAHSGGGLTLTGVLPHLQSGVLGLGATRATSNEGREVIGELFYKTPLFSRLSVVMDAQHVNQTDGSQSRRAGNLVTLRTIVTF
ncbi:MAG: carbohydrate porin [Gemmatimonadaceae bacterium]